MTAPAITRYPLCWPPGRTRTPLGQREAARFKTNPGRARDQLFDELRRLGAERVILSTNVAVRLDGLPYAGRLEPVDTGVAVYFTHNGRDMVFACDRWNRVHDNMLAVRHTVEALRGIERWGTGEMVQAAFTGFTALPPATTPARRWWDVLGVPSHAPTDDVREAFRQLTMRHHPDRNGGDQEPQVELNVAYEQFRRERGL